MSYTILVLLAFVAVTQGGPLHASCKINWNFGTSCTQVQNRIVNQIKAWQGPDGCKNGGEKCLYTLVSNTQGSVKAVHETPKKHYKDDLTFTFKPASNACTVAGFSTSETWYALLDYGTNYCNLHNLITGSGLNSTAGYQESTSNSVCTQYTSSNCEVY